MFSLHLWPNRAPAAAGYQPKGFRSSGHTTFYCHLRMHPQHTEQWQGPSWDPLTHPTVSHRGTQGCSREHLFKGGFCAPAGLRVAPCRLAGTSGLSHKERGGTRARICMGSPQNSASAIFLEEVPPLTHWHHLSLYTWWHLLAFFMCQGINIRAEQGRKGASSWGLGGGKHLGCAASGHGTGMGPPVGAKPRGQQLWGLAPLKQK